MMNPPGDNRMGSVFYQLLHRPVAFSMAFGTMLVSGLLAFLLLPIERAPSRTYPALTIRTRWENTSPETVEMFLTAPLEGIAGTIRGVHNVTSVSREGNSSVSVGFEPGTDMNFSRLELTEKLVSFKQNLSVPVSGPYIESYVPEELRALQGFLTYSLVGNQSATELRCYAERNIVPHLLSVSGVRTVNVIGGEQREIRIELDPRRLRALGVSAGELTAKVGRAATCVPMGTITAGAGRHPLVLRNTIAALADFRELPVARSRGGTTVRLADVALVRDTSAEPRSVSRINGKPSVTIVIDKMPDVNMLQVADRVFARVAELAAALPPAMEIMSEIDQSGEMRIELDRLSRNAVASIACIALVLMLFLGSLRCSLVVLSSILFSLAGTFLVLYLLGIRLTLVTLTGLELAFGRLVNDSIVVMDNLQRHAGDADRQGGMYRAVKEVAMPVAASTFTTVSALIPVAFLPPDLRTILADCAIAVGVSLLLSLLVSLTLIPVMISRMAPAHYIDGFLDRMGEGVNDAYQWTVQKALRHGNVILVLTILTLGETGYLFLTRVLDEDAESYARETYLTVWAGFPQGTQIRQCDALAAAVEREVLKNRVGVRKLTTQVADNVARVRIDFHDSASYDAAPLLMKQRLTLFAARTGGAKISVLGFGPGFSSGAESAPSFVVKIAGYNYNRVKEIARVFRKKLETNPRIAEVDVDGSLSEWAKSFELAVIADRAAIARHGLTVIEVISAISTSGPGAIAGNTISFEGNQVHFTLTYAGQKDYAMQDLRSVRLTNANGAPVRLTDLVTIGETRTPVEIRRENKEYVRWISCEYKGPGTFGAKIVDATISSMRLPAGYRIERSSSWSALSNESRNSFVGITPAVLLIVFMVLASMVESFVIPLIVMIAIPFSLIGLLLAFSLTGTQCGLGGCGAAVLLIGIVVTNSVVMVDDIASQVSTIGRDVTVLIGAAKRGIRRVFMTAVATIAGLLPLLATGDPSGVLHSLVVGSIGGLASSTLLTLVVVPVAFAAVFRLKRG